MTFILSSATPFTLVKSKILYLGKKLQHGVCILDHHSLLASAIVKKKKLKVKARKDDLFFPYPSNDKLPF